MSAGETANEGNSNLTVRNTEVRAEQVRLLFQPWGVTPVNLIVASVTSVALWPLYPPWMLSVWLGAFCLVILAPKMRGATGAPVRPVAIV